MADKKKVNIGDIIPDKLLMERGQFYQRGGSVYCFRPACVGCSYDAQCDRQETMLKVGPGVNVREAFVARVGFKIAAIDFRGIELRVAAQLSGEPVWVEAFQSGNDDLHTAMAKVCFKTDSPTDKQRKTAKCGNFNNLYLGSARNMQTLSDLTEPEAIIAHRSWWAAVPTYKKWTERQIAIYRQQSYVETCFHRKRNMLGMIAAAKENESKTGKKGGRKVGWGYCDRSSINTQIQGSSADLLKIAMVRVDRWIRSNKLQNDIKMLLTVHDELVFEVRDCPDMYEWLREIGRQMTQTPKGEVLPKIDGWRVPLAVDIEIGCSWGDMVKIEDLDPQVEAVRSIVSTPQELDECLVIISSLTKDQLPKFQMAVFQASNRSNTIKVPLKVQMGHNAYHSRTMYKVDPIYLKQALQGMAGIEVRG